MTTIARLQRWYMAQCNGDWEHRCGVEIGTLDNPGWRVAIDLEGTALAGAPFAEVSDPAMEVDWFRCWVEGNRFHGAGGVQMLEAILEHFLRWAEGGPSGVDV